MPHTTLLRELEGFSLTTAEILYRLPDYPQLLQSYIWQDYDVAPEFPKLVDFLDYWAPSIPLSSASPLPGHLVYTWGFPGGVFHVQPLLSVGYLAGVHEHIGTNGTVVERWYVNAAFNLGNSGGALMLREAAIGVISRKVAPLK